MPTRIKRDAKGTTRDRSLWDRLVNERFGDDRPVLSPEESVKAAKKLYRHVMGKTWTGPVVLTTGRNYTYVRRGVLRVNPNQNNGGFRELIHSLSHHCHSRLHPNDAPHSKRQAQIEGRMVKFALSRGFTTGALKREPPPPKAKPTLVQQRYARLVNRRDKCAKEAERSKRLLAKAQAEVRAYERRHGDKVKG